MKIATEAEKRTIEYNKSLDERRDNRKKLAVATKEYQRGQICDKSHTKDSDKKKL